MQKPPPMLLQVKSTSRITPNMQRITLTGEQLADFPLNHETATLKLLLPHPGQSVESHLQSLTGVGVKPIKRTYSVRAFRPDSRELDIEFALHPDPGPATSWALQAQIGESVAIAGPGRPRRLKPDADWYLLGGDMSALPALLANCQLLPTDARGYVVIEIHDNADQQQLTLPSAMELCWCISTEPDDLSSPFVEQLKAKTWLSGTPYVWLAGETPAIGQLRQWLSETKQLPASHRHCSGYWHRGYNEDAFQPIKRQEPDQ